MLERRNYKVKRLIRNILVAATALGAVYSCASVGRPDGGPYDETPPRFIGSTPTANALNNTRTRIVLEFDEFIKLEKPNEKVVISPPQLKQPEIKPAGRRITINILDSLLPNTTYTIDFADAIVDNNEGNPLGDFSFVFSTGDVIDSMRVSGTVLEASNLEPIKGMLVGLHSNLADSAFTSLPFERVSRTDSRGKFTIRGIAPGTYRLYALIDNDQNYIFSQKSEAIAFLDSLVIPHFDRRIRQDTTWIDSLTIDTIIERDYTHYLPDDLIMRSFKEESVIQYLIRSERLQPFKFSLFFANKADTLPTVRGLNFDERDAFIIEHSQRNDTIHYWIRDSLIYKLDTLKLGLDYLYTDTLNQLVPRTDTLKLSMRRSRGGNQEKEQEKERKRRKKDDEEDIPEPTVFLKSNVNVPSAMDVYGSVTLSFEEPIAHYNLEAIHLKQKVDTVFQEIPFEFEQDSIALSRFYVYTEWEPQGEYEFSLDSIAFTGIYGLHTDKVTQTFKVRSLDEYSKIFFNISGLDGPAFVELLDAQDKVIRKITVVNNQADFYFLMPGKYSARLIVDRNQNGVWDTGNYEEKLQPEEVYYFPKILETKALWDFEEAWNLKATPLDKQKVDELKKQKPDEPKQRESRNAERNRSSGRN